MNKLELKFFGNFTVFSCIGMYLGLAIGNFVTHCEVRNNCLESARISKSEIERSKFLECANYESNYLNNWEFFNPTSRSPRRPYGDSYPQD